MKVSGCSSKTGVEPSVGPFLGRGERVDVTKGSQVGRFPNSLSNPPTRPPGRRSTYGVSARVRRGVGLRRVNARTTRFSSTATVGPCQPTGGKRGTWGSLWGLGRGPQRTDVQPSGRPSRPRVSWRPTAASGPPLGALGGQGPPLAPGLGRALALARAWMGEV